MLKSLYSESSAQIALDKTSKEFPILRGVKQGDPLSPILFNAVLEDIFRDIKKKWLDFGIKIDQSANDQLTNLRFADDVLLVASSREQAVKMLDDLMEAARLRGLEIHPDKTNIMSHTEARTEKEHGHATLSDGSKVRILDFEEKAKYLGRHVSFSDPDAAELDHRIKQAWRKFHAQKSVLCNNKYPIKQRVKLFSSTITPTILYGAGAWTLTQDAIQKLKKTQRQMLRSIFQKGRRKRPACQDASDTSESSESELRVAPECEGEELEPWAEWIQRVTHEIENTLEHWKIEDWHSAVDGYSSNGLGMCRDGTTVDARTKF